MTPAVRLHHFRYGTLENFKRLISVVQSVPTHLLRNWREKRPSNQGDLD
jgi:hypothetical protein